MTDPHPLRTRRYRAAGGVVLDVAGRVLVLERWIVREGQPVFEVRLPKGHVDDGESDLAASLREVLEETGYGDLQLLADLGEYANRFDLPDEIVIRDEHYYLYRAPGPAGDAPPPPIAAPEAHSAGEALFVVRWLPDLAAAEEAITFGSERDFVRRAREHLGQANSAVDNLTS